mgnify:CR=1 FL=1
MQIVSRYEHSKGDLPMNPSSHANANSLRTRALPSSLEDDEMHHSVNAVILPSSVLYSERSGDCSM